MIKKNIKIFISILFSLILIIILLIFFQNKRNKEILEQSILFEKAIQTENDELAIELLEKIKKHKTGFKFLSKIEIINLLNKQKKYNQSLDLYIEILNDKKINQNYKNLLALKASYELFDNLSSMDIKRLLSYTNENSSYYGFILELKFLLSIKDNKSTDMKILYDQIVNNINISQSVKDRVKKIHEYQQYSK